MFEITFRSAPRYDGAARTVRVIDVTCTLTDKIVSVCYPRPFEAKQAWVDRAIADAERRVREEPTVLFQMVA